MGKLILFVLILFFTFSTPVHSESSFLLGYNPVTKQNYKLLFPFVNFGETEGICAYLSLKLNKPSVQSRISIDIGIPDERYEGPGVSATKGECNYVETVKIDGTNGIKKFDITKVVQNKHWKNGVCLQTTDYYQQLLEFSEPEGSKFTCVLDCPKEVPIYKPIPETKPEPVPPKVKQEVKPKQTEKSDTKIKTIPKPTPPKKVSQKNVLGTQTKITDEIEQLPRGTCIINYYLESNKFKLLSCSIPQPQITSLINRKNQYDYLVKMKGQLTDKILVKVNYYRCKRKTIKDIKTIFGCVQENYKKVQFETVPRNRLIISLKPEYLIITRDITNSGSFSSVISIKANPQNQKIAVRSMLTLSDTVSGNRFVFLKESPYSHIFKIPAPVISKNTSSLDFIFNKPKGVTQWYGYTDFMKPHTGIDFGVKKERVISPADGVVKDIGWDSYYGKCLSGGRYIRIEHNNGLNTVYMHLEKLNKNKGDKVKKGEQIALSGNTGAFNCQPLAYHLHFETRKTVKSSSHTNPVPLINVDWNKIPTLGWKQNPGRLSGDNPHPNF